MNVGLRFYDSSMTEGGGMDPTGEARQRGAAAWSGYTASPPLNGLLT
jgi:hypothetical protein